jgi:hypothetical protein
MSWIVFQSGNFHELNLGGKYVRGKGKKIKIKPLGGFFPLVIF